MSTDGHEPAAPKARAADAALSESARAGWASSLTAATLAGLLAWAGGEWVEQVNQVPIVSEHVLAGSSQLATRAAAMTTRSSVAYGLLGAFLAAALGLVGGLARRSRPGALAGVGVGLILGALAGAGAARVLVPVFLRNENTQAEDLLLPLLTHAGIWSLVGAAAGLSLGVGLLGFAPRAARGLFGGLTGGVLATIVYELAGALAFPLDQTGQPISVGAGSRLFARLVVSLTVALVAVAALRSPARSRG